MHDIVRDIAILIAKEEKAFLVKHGVEEWPETGTYEKYLAISLRSETISELPDELVCPELHTLMLECSSYEFERDTKIPDRFFRGTEKLMVLELDNVSMLPLPSSLRQLTELRMLCLNECKLGDIGILECLKNKLEVLRLRGSDIVALPSEVGELTRLRLLDLGDCDELEVIRNGVISKLYRLEELHFPRSFENWEGTTGNEEISKVSLDELMSLTRLSTLAIHIPNHRLLPKDRGFQNLIRFNITVGAKRYSYSEDYSVVVLRGIDIDDDFNILERLLGKPGRGGLYPSRSFDNLTQLVLERCRLKYLFSPSCARGLLQLQLLQIQGSEIMEAVIGNEGEKDEIIANVISFSQLKTLKLRGLSHLISFYPRIKKATTIESHSFPPTQSLFNEKVAFPALEKLSINSVPNIIEIWDKNLLSTESFCRLRSLKIRYCGKLTNVVPSHMLPQLKSIKTLGVAYCQKMEVIVVLEKREEDTQEAANKDTIIVQFPQLRILRLENLERLSSFNYTSIITKTRSLFNHQVAFSALEELYINSVTNITEIWDKNLLSTESFCLLRSLKIQDCEKLKNVVPSHMLPQLKSIETLEVSRCPKMEVIVVLEKREEETQEATNKDMIIVFPQLRDMTLRGLENLNGVCAFKSENQLCFNVQVAFPSLEELSIYEMPNITKIWDKNLLQPESFSLPRSLGIQGCEKLRSLKVKGCEKLMNVIPSHILPQLKNIKTLEVSKCPEMEVIVVLEKREEETQEATNKDIIVFPELTSLTLEELENLKGVCAYKSEDRLCFNIQVVFPTLEELFISSMPSITEIWDKNLLQSASFSLSRSLGIRGCEKLSSLKVKGCEKLMNVVPSHMLPQLNSIKTLEVSKCPEMEVIVVLEKKEKETQEATNKDIIVFPELTRLTLEELENLKGVCAYKFEDRLCFNVQVAFPALEKLFISSMPSITEIWDKNLLQPESFSLSRSLGIRDCEKLRFLKVKGCEKLMNVVPSHMLPQLKSIETLDVSKCPEMEVIVVLEKKEKETQEATNKDIIVFPKLTSLTLGGLENLKGVCAYKFEDRLCFNVQVAFPALEELTIDELPYITKIWDKNLLQPESFCLLRSSGVRGYEKLRSLKVRNCKKLMNVVPSHMLPLLKNIRSLWVSNCPEMEVIVVLEKREEETREAANNDTIIVFPELMLLTLQELENLKGVCAYKSEDRLCFNVQVVFPNLITSLPYLYLDTHSEKIVTEATSRKQEYATTDASSSGMQLQP